MTTDDPHWKFKNRVRKMIAEKIGADAIGSTKYRKNFVANFTGPPVPVVEREQEIVLSDDGAANDVSDDDDARQQRKRSVTQLDIENFDGTAKEGLRDKKRKTQAVKNHGKSVVVSLKERLNLNDMQIGRKKSGSEILIVKPTTGEKIFLGDVDSDASSSGEYSSSNVETDETMTFLGPRKRFGEPIIVTATDNNLSENKFGEPKTIIMTENKSSEKKFGEPLTIRGTPKVVSTSSIFESSIPDLKRPSRVFNWRGNILSNFFSDVDDVGSNLKPMFFHSGKIIQESSEEEEQEEEQLGEDADRNSIYDSDASFNWNKKKFISNSSLNQTSDSMEQSRLCDDSTVSESDGTEKPKFYCLQNKVIAMMGPSCKFYFNGKLRVKILVGKVEIYGAIFSRRETLRPAEIYSPRGSSLVSIETVPESEAETDDESLSTLLKHEGINNDAAMDLENKLRELPEGQAVIILENFENTLTKFLDLYSPFKLFPKSQDSANYQNYHPKKAERLLQAIFQHEDSGRQMQKDYYRESRILNRFLNRDAEEGRRILIAGGKGVGKSTTLRHFVNGLLPIHKEIVVVDFDPGQPEFTPPGCISLNIIDHVLTGPNYTHSKLPFHQIFIGDVNVARCVPRYVKAARKLVNCLNESPRLRGRLVVVNTMGFCTGIGWDLMVYIVKLIHPSTVIQITSDRSKNNYPFLLSSDIVNEQSPTPFTGGEEESSVWEVVCDHELDVVPSLAEVKGKTGDFWELEPRHQRELMLLAYLSGILKDNEDEERFLLSGLPRINEAIPYSIQLSKLTISLIRPIVPASHILATMNGNIVALCGIDETEENDEATDNVHPKTLLRAPVSTCYGFGIVRGVDMQKGKVFVNTPLTVDQLRYVNSFVDSIPLPATLIHDQDNRNAPYVGDYADLPTSREPRRGYFRMRQRNS